MSSPSAPKKTETKVTQNTIDPAMLPYYTDVAKRAQGLGNTPYQGYTGETVAGFDPMEIQAQQATAALTSPGEYNQAQAGYQRGLDYNPGMFGSAEAAQYMSPYQKNVTDIGIRDLNEQAARSMALAGVNSARTGGYGGSGNAIMNATTARTLNRDVGDLSTKGQQDAYLNAQQQYQRDRTAREYAQTLGQNSASGLASLGNNRQTSDLARIGAQNASGTARRDLQQRRDDLQKEEFINQRDYSKNQTTWESQLLNAQPMGSYEQQTGYKTPSNSASQLAGTAATLVGAYNDANKRGPTYAKGGSVMSSLTTGPFQNLSATWAQLMQLTPQQMAKVSELGTAPPYLVAAAMDAQNKFREEGQPAAGPAAPSVVQQVVDKAVGAPPAGQAMPASPAPTQMAARGGYIHDYGVASLPYEANYGHGGIVSFANEGAVKAPPAAAPAEDPDGLTQQLKAYINENPNNAKIIAGAGALGAVKLPGYVGKAWGLLPQGAKTVLKRYALTALKIGTVAGTGVAAESYVANRLNAPALDAAKTALAGDEVIPSDPAATEEPPEKDPGLGIAGLGGGTATLQRTVLSNLVPLDVSEAKTAEQLKEDQDRVNGLYGLGKDFYEQERARNDAKLSALEAERKGVYSGQGLMDWGAAMAAGKSSNFLDNFADAVPAYTGAIKSGNEYARDRQDLLDTHADLLRGQQRSEGRSDAANMLAAETASTDAKRAGDNANTAAQNEQAMEQGRLDSNYNTNMANLANSALDRQSRAAIAQMSVDLRSKAAAYGGRGLSSKDMALELGKYAAQVLPGLQEQAKELGLEGADAADMIHKLTMSGFASYMKDSGVAAAPMNNAGRGGIFSDPGDE